jgi:hypothetical protein
MDGSIGSYQNRVNLTPESKIETKKVEQTSMDVNNEIISLGDDMPYQDAPEEPYSIQAFYADNLDFGDYPGEAGYTKYGRQLFTKNFTNKVYTAKTMVKMAKKPSNSFSYSSVKNTAVCNKSIFMINKCVNLINKSKTEYDELWIIDSGASHHVTNELRDFTSYKPYATPEKIQTANMHDSLMIVGKGTVFFDTETTNKQIHTVHLDNVCYIPNGSNQLLSRGQLCLNGLVEKADSKSTTFLLPTGHIFLRGFPRNSTDMLHWVQSKIAHPNVPMAEPLTCRKCHHLKMNTYLKKMKKNK